MDDKELYDLLMMLDRLEELREDLEALEREGRTLDEADDDLRAELAALGVVSSADLERRIAELNAQIDRLEPAEWDA